MTQNKFEKKPPKETEKCYRLMNHTCIYEQERALKVEFIERCLADPQLFSYCYD